MPPRKSTASTAPLSPNAGDVSIMSAVTTGSTGTEPKSPVQHKGNRQSTGGDADGEKSEKKKAKNDDLGIDDLLLPRTLTSRLARGTLPPNTSIQRDALLALTKSATVFISYLAHNANQLTSRKTIQSNDILEALHETELWNVPVGNGATLGERVRAEVEKWEGEVRGKRKGYRERVKARESGGPVPEKDGEEEEEEVGRGPVAKRARRGSSADLNMDGDGDGDEEEDDAAAAQLQGEAAANEDGTETDAEAEEDEDAEEEDEEEDEEDSDEPRNLYDDELQGDPADAEEAAARKARGALAPNGRVEVGSDEESD